MFEKVSPLGPAAGNVTHFIDLDINKEWHLLTLAFRPQP